jgi:hypothetical protein
MNWRTIITARKYERVRKKLDVDLFTIIEGKDLRSWKLGYDDKSPQEDGHPAI